MSSLSQSLLELDNLKEIFNNLKKNLTASIDFGQIQYQRFSIDILIYLCAVWRRQLKFD